MPKLFLTPKRVCSRTHYKLARIFNISYIDARKHRETLAFMSGPKEQPPRKLSGTTDRCFSQLWREMRTASADGIAISGTKDRGGIDVPG